MVKMCLKWQWAGRCAMLYTQTYAICFLTLLFNLPVAKQCKEAEGLLHFLGKLYESKHALFPPLQAFGTLVSGVILTFLHYIPHDTC